MLEGIQKFVNMILVCIINGVASYCNTVRWG